MRTAIRVPIEEVQITAIRAQGAGGQNVNKVSNAVHLRYDVRASTLSQEVRERVLQSGDRRISREGVIVIKAQEFRSLEKNRAEAIRRLEDLLARLSFIPRARRPTRPSRASVARRLEDKARRASIKSGRGRTGE